MEDVRRVREAVRPVELAPVEQLADELAQLPLRVLPREVRVALGEARLRKRRHRRRPRERLRKEHDLGVLPLHLADEPLPERGRLRVRVVDAEHRDALAHPVEHDVEQRLPQRRASPRSRSRRCRCPGSASAGSRRTSVSRRAGGRTTPDARSATGGRASTAPRNRARSRCRACAPPRRASETPPRVPSSGWIASCPPSVAPIAHGLPTSPGPARSALLRPLRFVTPIGWIGGR